MSETPKGPVLPPKIETFTITKAGPKRTNPYLATDPARVKARRSSKIWGAFKIVLSLLLFFALGVGVVFFIKAGQVGSKIFVGKNGTDGNPISTLIKGGASASLQGEENGQVNVLLLGVGGQGHDGAYLTDSIILAQFKTDEKKVALTSLPRDFLVHTSDLGYRKINAVFAESYMKTKDWNKAGEDLREVVEKIAGVPVPYFAVIDFSGFEKAIDELGGLDVTIDNSFTDYTYPDNNNGYLPPVTFKAGNEVLNGKRALQFVRSRHASGVEGSDFARSRRQQKVMTAAKEKFFSLGLLTDPAKLNNLLNIFADHFHTNFTLNELVHIANLGKDVPREAITGSNLDIYTGLVCSATLDSNGAYVVTPCSETKALQIPQFIANSFTNGLLYSEKAVIWMADTNPKSPYYKQAEKDLIGLGLNVVKIGYSGSTVANTLLFQATPTPQTTLVLKQLLGLEEVNQLPKPLKLEPTKMNIVVLIGSNGWKGLTQNSNLSVNSSQILDFVFPDTLFRKGNASSTDDIVTEWLTQPSTSTKSTSSSTPSTTKPSLNSKAPTTTLPSIPTATTSSSQSSGSLSSSTPSTGKPVGAATSTK